MSTMIEVLYRVPPSLDREAQIVAAIGELGGTITCREEPGENDLSQAVCLTFEFFDRQTAEAAAIKLRDAGEHVEGPTDYGHD